MLASTGESTQQQNPKERHHPHCCENLKSQKIFVLCTFRMHLETFCIFLVSDMQEPVYEYDFPEPYIRPQKWFPLRQPFNL
jgi:hypothetical protein